MIVNHSFFLGSNKLDMFIYIYTIEWNLGGIDEFLGKFDSGKDGDSIRQRFASEKIPESKLVENIHHWTMRNLWKSKKSTELHIQTFWSNITIWKISTTKSYHCNLSFQALVFIWGPG